VFGASAGFMIITVLLALWTDRKTAAPEPRLSQT
jgi:hypothetical protein